MSAHQLHTPARFVDARPGGSWLRYASASTLYPLLPNVIPYLALFALLVSFIGLYIGLFVAPTDAQQGEVYRIIFVHVPSAWLSMLIYLAMAFWAGIGLVFNTRLSSMLATALAPTGAMFTVLALWTGALWGRPTWGAWWVWDARLTSYLILLFFYIGFIALQSAIDDPRRSDRAGALLLLVGVVNLPIIYFSVQWWNTLHQGSSINFNAAPKMAYTMLAGMLVMTVGLWAYAIAAALTRLRCIILERESHSEWVARLAEFQS